MPMLGYGAQTLAIGASLSAIAGFAHLACIFIGAPAYRAMGAGQRMARAAEQGKLLPTFVTLAIAAVLFLWSAYALSGAGLIEALPQSKPALALISSVYLVRALAFPLLKPAFPENSDTFWIASSGISGCIGLVYAYGTFALWRSL